MMHLMHLIRLKNLTPMVELTHMVELTPVVELMQKTRMVHTMQAIPDDAIACGRATLAAALADATPRRRPMTTSRLAILFFCLPLLSLGCNDSTTSDDADVTDTGAGDAATDATGSSDAASDAPADAGDDSGADTGGECDLGLPEWAGDDYQGRDPAHFSFASADGTVVLRFVRVYEDSGVGESSIFSLTGVSVTTADFSACILDADAIAYENTHHNWYDTFDATADGITWHFEWRWQMEWTEETGPFVYVLSALLAEATILPETELTRLAGPVWN